MSHEAVLQGIRDELRRVGAGKVQVAIDPNFEPKAGELVRVKLESAEWRLLPPELEQLLKELPENAGDEGVRKAIETKTSAVWHGPAPKDSRDTSHHPT
jgi:hypothetical protein